jgi:hypothetical protein
MVVFLVLSCRWGSVVNAMPVVSYSGRTWCPLYERLGGVGGCGKSRVLCVLYSYFVLINTVFVFLSFLYDTQRNPTMRLAIATGYSIPEPFSR